MPGLLLHSPANIIRYLLIELGIGVLPTAGGSWPINCPNEPDAPDNVITLKGTVGYDAGITFPDMERMEYHGFQVRVRCGTYNTGYAKARQIAIAMDQVYCQTITIDGTTYCVQSIKRGDVIELGKEIGVSKRELFTVNGTADLIKQD